MSNLETPQLTQSTEFAPIDLMERRSNNVLVIMYWLKSTNSIYLNLIDEQTGESDYFPVPNDKAMDAFAHPFFYRSLNSI